MDMGGICSELHIMNCTLFVLNMCRLLVLGIYSITLISELPIGSVKRSYQILQNWRIIHRTMVGWREMFHCLNGDPVRSKKNGRR